MDQLPFGSRDRNDKLVLDMSCVSSQCPLWPLCSCIRSGLYWVYLHHYNEAFHSPEVQLIREYLMFPCVRRAGEQWWADLWVHTCTCQLCPSLPFSLLIFWIEYICRRRELSLTCRCTRAGLDPWMNFDFASNSKANSPDNQQIP